MPTAGEIFGENVRNYSAGVEAVRRKIGLVAWLRLLTFSLLAFFVYRCFTGLSQVWLLGGLLSLVIFLVLVRISLYLKDKRLLLEKLLYINRNELQLLQHEANSFSDGKIFQSSGSLPDDLDIFGTGSLFQLLNRTTTCHGEEKLAGMLRDPFFKKAEIVDTQEAIKVLSEQVMKRQLITASGLLYDEKPAGPGELSAWTQAEGLLFRKSWLRIAKWLLPAFALAGAYYYLATDSLSLLVPGVLLNWSLTGFFLPYINRQHSLLGRKQSLLDQYTGVLKAFGEINADSSSLLRRLQEQASQAHRSIQQLSKLTQAFDQRLNMLVSLLLNSFLLYDVHCCIRLETWKEKNRALLPAWIACLANIEYLNSLAAWAFQNPGYTYPVVDETIFRIEARGIAHPLIPAGERVANDFVLGDDERLQVITGSNMSGKTTFLRTVGVNLLLARCGAPVCASFFTCPPLQLLSCVRVSDSLQEHTSYFMAELKRLQEMIHRLETGPAALVLIDEILRGTNSEDKTHGSEQFIRKLLQYPCLALFATHDLNLGGLETALPDLVHNFCFESEIRDGQLYFDYTLRRGIAKNRNASFLMEKMGII
ncbi:MAG TPA: hypothetical protein VMI35_01685 [Puia sp.]|nr:hypothetical protein [Puia sp.]